MTSAVTELTDVAHPTDWLDRICPYLLSEDGTSRSAQPDPRHRCMAQDPPGTPPSLFQERFCLTDRHVRCEMYKQAESTRSMALAQDSVAAEQVRRARFRPSVRSRPIALEPTAPQAASKGGSLSAARPLLVAVLGAGGLALVLMFAVLLFGGFGATAPPLDGASPSAEGGAPQATPESTLRPTATPGLSSPPDVTPATSASSAVILIRYKVQPGERLAKVGRNFGVRRSAISKANPELGEPPEVSVGDVIKIPVPAGTPAEAIESVPGFLGYAKSE